MTKKDKVVLFVVNNRAGSKTYFDLEETISKHSIQNQYNLAFKDYNTTTTKQF